MTALVARMRRYSSNDVQELLQEILEGREVEPENQHSAIADALDLCLAVQEYLVETPANIAASKTVSVTFAAQEDGKIKVSSHSQEGERVLMANEIMEVRNDRGYVQIVKRKR